jgi:hypothetical protein
MTEIQTKQRKNTEVQLLTLAVWAGGAVGSPCPLTGLLQAIDLQQAFSVLQEGYFFR